MTLSGRIFTIFLNEVGKYATSRSMFEMLLSFQVKTWFQNRRMKEKRQQRDEDHSRSFMIPTGGVDIAQLVAMGMPYPPPHNIGGTNLLPVPGYFDPKKMTSPQQISPLSRHQISSPLAFYGSPFGSSMEGSSMFGHSY